MPVHPLSLDAIDIAILGALQEDASIANAELATRVGLSASACLSRTKRLRENGFITHTVAVVDERRVGLGITAFAFVTLAGHGRRMAESFLRRIQETPQVMECWHVTGRADYLLKIVASDIDSYRDFLMDTLVQTEEVGHVETQVVLKAEKRSFKLPIGKREGGPL
ncbi:MAG: Lrp/AsnC family transcriptional regulator [Thermoleophilia bacterium]|nr:Lrp/AsnC family transcriptional regulator [Thermoleophilia bacterium]